MKVSDKVPVRVNQMRSLDNFKCMNAASKAAAAFERIEYSKNDEGKRFAQRDAKTIETEVGRRC